MKRPYLIALIVITISLLSCPELALGQQVRNVEEAFQRLSEEPTLIMLANDLEVPTKGGHLQGVQVVEKNGNEKLLFSGSSAQQAYLLQADLSQQKTEQFIPLMKSPFRHAGGMQVSEQLLVVGIEDNHAKTKAKVCLYDFRDTNFYKAVPTFTFDRHGEPKRPTAGASGLLPMDDGYLVVVGNWDSRNWDFYQVNAKQKQAKMLFTFAAPDDWGNYQSINLIKDEEAIYAMGFYKKNHLGQADLILVSKGKTFEPIMEKVSTKTFTCKGGVDFQTAVGLQVDAIGKLHIWATQRDALHQMAVNKFSEQ